MGTSVRIMHSVSKPQPGFARALGVAGELRIRWQSADKVVVLLRGRIAKVAGAKVRFSATGATLRQALETLWELIEPHKLVDEPLED